MAIRGLAGLLWMAGTAAVVADTAGIPAGAAPPTAPAAGAFASALPLRIVLTAGTAGLRLTAGFPCRP